MMHKTKQGQAAVDHFKLEYPAVTNTLEEKRKEKARICYRKKLLMRLWKQTEKNMEGKKISNFTEVLKTSGPLL
ncbi:hypothetical protein A6R68_23652 [Neotoma lepida]|uniref:Uncharacterized protein n=1 Tax=Neotoma lepida TaxID=56216 RepID=A0A1A6HXB2_NEOLE|nr:hypothetical protein A6R68_23652 [Neotoma lepida]